MDPAILSSIKYLQRSHTLSRYTLELQLETAPRESRYSTSLMELMRREEIEKGQSHNQQQQQQQFSVSSKVDEMLKAGSNNYNALVYCFHKFIIGIYLICNDYHESILY